MTLFTTIIYEVRAGVALLTMNRPEVRNGLNRDMTLELLGAVQAAGQDIDVRTLLLTGAGSAFCSGADLGAVNTDPAPEHRARQRDEAARFVREAVNPLMRAIYHCPKPVIAAVNGPAVGGGIGLALAADIVLAAESARLIPNFTPKLALIPDLGSTWTLPRLIGRGRTLALALLGEPVSGRQAENWGLVWRCYPDEDLAGEAMAMAQRLSNGPASAMSRVKRALQASPANDFDEQLDLELELAAECCFSLEFCEAADAFLNKRAPRFHGTA